MKNKYVWIIISDGGETIGFSTEEKRKEWMEEQHKMCCRSCGNIISFDAYWHMATLYKVPIVY